MAYSESITATSGFILSSNSTKALRLVLAILARTAADLSVAQPLMRPPDSSEYCQNKPDIDAKCNQKKGQDNLPNTWHGQPSNGRHRRQGKQRCSLYETISCSKKFSV